MPPPRARAVSPPAWASTTLEENDDEIDRGVEPASVNTPPPLASALSPVAETRFPSTTADRNVTKALLRSASTPPPEAAAGFELGSPDSTTVDSTTFSDTLE